MLGRPHFHLFLISNEKWGFSTLLKSKFDVIGRIMKVRSLGSRFIEPSAVSGSFHSYSLKITDTH